MIIQAMPYPSAVAGFDPATLFASAEAGVWYDFSDLSSMFQNSDGTTAAVVGQPVGYVADKSGNGNHLVQATTSLKPILRQDGGGNYYLEFDGVDDKLNFTSSLAGLGAGSNVIAGMQTTDTQWILISRSTSGSNFAAVAQNGSTSSNTNNSGTPTYTVNRAALATNDRNGLHDAMSSANPKVLSISGLDVTTYTTAMISAYASWPLDGKMYNLLVHESLTSTEVEDYEDWSASKMGITL